ncbi:restriction endonuclease subunit S [Klebsiella quasipneumoniae]|uniref:restriction endonuclease subunit S n=1 Tax=Klebsiella quasipneumoniae TaxID=1463165 RepID=UPI003A80A589
MGITLKMQSDKLIPAGYKLTEMGVIPEDWGVFTLNDLMESCSSGATPFRGNKNYYKGSNRWITSGELNYCIINDTLEKISDEAVKRSNLKIHPAGTFLMAITGLEATGTRGACGIVGQPAATNQSCMAIYPNDKLSSLYLYH